jgi:glycosyltransferase involved in cell wall biosynthesis
MQESPVAPWEVLVIDNASTDGTAEFARSCWQNGPVPLRVINEPRPGVRYARERGFLEAGYDFLGFVDDDNWLAHDWVRNAYDIISSDSRLGAVGSIRDAACEVSSPAWFDDFHESYAVLTERDLEQMTEPLRYLPTAGLCVRGAAWDQLVRNGFRFQLPGRVGNNLHGGEDVELTMALRLTGWNLRIDRRLRLQHFMPRRRLEWRYLRRMLRDYGASHVPIDAYTDYSLSLEPGIRTWVSDSWWYQLGKSLKRIASQPSAVVATLSSDGVGRNQIMSVEKQFGRVLGLFRLRGRYGEVRRGVRHAPWRRANVVGPDHVMEAHGLRSCSQFGQGPCGQREAN